MSAMRAKMKVSSVSSGFYPEDNKTSETLTLNAVCASSYDSTGLDEDNTYARFSPSAELVITITNPALFDKFVVGEKYYLDFTKA